MDMSELFKRHLAKLHKGNNVIKTVQDRKEHLINERRTKRETLTNARRNINLDMSPYCTPVASQTIQRRENKTTLTKESEKRSVAEGVSKRLELLAKWKAERAKQKQLEKAKQKPIFKVYHVSPKASVNLENVNKGHSSVKKSQFAPPNHKFRPPEGIKPLNFSRSSTKSKVLETPWKITKSPKRIGTLKTPHENKQISDNKVSKNKANHSQSKPTKEKENQKKPISKTLPSKNSVASVSKNRQTPVASTSQKKNDTNKTVKKSSQSNIKESTKAAPSTSKQKTPRSVNKPNSRSVKKETKLNERTPKSKSEELPNNEIQAMPNNEIKESPNNKIQVSPDNKINNVVKSAVLTPVYISPFVTISRGKRSAREEFKIRNSYGKEVLKQTSPEKLEFFSSHTSPTAGADYFMVKLNSEIDRINRICEEWDNYLQDPQLPDEAKSSIGVAVGQSKLLLSKKFKQFRGLIVQCKTKEYEGKNITCEDLHGFWDMVYMQVEDLDRRFANLERLKENNWEELLPEKKAPVRKTRARTKKPTGTSRLKDIIKAAREKKNFGKNTIAENETNAAGHFQVQTPVKEEPSTSNPESSRKNLRVSLLTTENRKRPSSSPGLTLMKISQSIKQGNGLTPAKSILKSDNTKSTGKKSVVFKENLSPMKLRRTVLFNESKKEITRKSVVCNEEEKENTPNGLRRSSRLAKGV